ncbi:translin-associated protein X-like [Branchiostoma floridae x Branchiostoma japonicum]
MAARSGQRGGHHKRNYGKDRVSHQKISRREPKVDENSPIIASFCTYQALLDRKNDKYERLVKMSRDVTIQSKRAIFHIHRINSGVDKTTVLGEADEKLIAVREKLCQIALELQGEDLYQFIRAVSPGLQEYIEAVAFHHYCLGQGLVSLTQVQSALEFPATEKTSSPEDGDCPSHPAVTLYVPPVEYMLGVADFTGELMRLCITSVSSGDMDLPFQLCQFMREVYHGFSSFSHAGSWELSRKMHTLRQSLHKVENACYTLQVRGLEIPKHMLADVFGSADSEDTGERRSDIS